MLIILLPILIITFSIDSIIFNKKPYLKYENIFDPASIIDFEVLVPKTQSKSSKYTKNINNLVLQLTILIYMSIL